MKNDAKLNKFSIENINRKKQRTTGKKDLDEALLKWFRIQRNANIPISGPILKEKATQFDISLGYGADFECSMSWINRFKQRHNINAGKVVGEAKSVDSTVTRDWLATSWLQEKRGYCDRHF